MPHFITSVKCKFWKNLPVTVKQKGTFSQEVKLPGAIDIAAANSLSFVVNLKEEVNCASILCKMPDEERNEGPEEHNHEEWQAGYPGDVSNLRHEDVPYWKDIVASRSTYPLRWENNLSVPEDK